MALLTPEFFQTQSYSAKRWRAAVARYGAVLPGVWEPSTDFLVTAGTGMNVNITGGAAWIAEGTNTDAANFVLGGMYHVENDATTTGAVALATGHATLPRIDQIAIEVEDTFDWAGSVDRAKYVVVAGTATSGATLDNRTGAASLGTNRLRLADVLVPAGAGSAAACTFRDRRLHARGCAFVKDLSSGNQVVATSATTEINGTRARVEVHDRTMIRFGILGRYGTPSAVPSVGYVGLQYSTDSGTTWNYMTSLPAAATNPWLGGQTIASTSANLERAASAHTVWVPALANLTGVRSFLVRAMFSVTNGTTWRMNGTQRVRYYFQELPQHGYFHGMASG